MSAVDLAYYLEGVKVKVKVKVVEALEASNKYRDS